MINSNSFENDDKKDFDAIKELFRYFYFWKFFLVSILICIFCAYLINRYSTKVYDIKAKIQILDKKQTSLEMPSAVPSQLSSDKPSQQARCTTHQRHRH